MITPLWQPDRGRIAGSNMQKFIEALAQRSDLNISSYDELYAFSLADSARFWAEFWDFAGIIGDKGEAPYLTDAGKLPGARFFPNAQLNFAENMLGKDGDETALVFWGEEKVKRRLSWNELGAQVAKAAQAMDEAGLGPGDRVAAIMPNCPETIVAMLGAASRGVVFSSASPDFGAEGILDRFAQIEPKLLIACDGYYYGGRTIDISDKLAAVAANLPSVEKVIVVPYLGNDAAVVQGLNMFLAQRDAAALTWADAVLAKTGGPLTFKRLPFGHPLYILFSSGTTGVPKCIVHSAGGTLLKHLSEHLLHTDIKADDRLFYFTTCGWMMWNWLVSGLAAGATLLLYDGSPFHPDANQLFDYADAEDMTHFGTSAKYIDALKKAGLRPRDTHDLTALRAMASTGSPLAPESFDYVYDAIKPDLHLASVSGGTDIVGCFVLGNPVKPVWRGEIQGAALGVAVDVFDEGAAPMRRGKGELVCTNAIPSMPVGFWNDPDGRRFRAAYYERFSGVWHHGDFAEWTEHGGMIIHGRSDATLNPGGVRIGTAEIYRQVEQLAEVMESVVIGQSFEGDTRIVLFVVLRPGLTLDDALRDKIKTQIRSGASPRHVPARILGVADIPRTRSGKITELAIADVVHGRRVKNIEALANPEALALFEDLAALRV